MIPLSRRRFIAASAASAASLGYAAAATGELDCAIVGAGAAGIAAARRLAGRAKIAVYEASDRIGGRCMTDTALFGVPFDRGAQSLAGLDVNPLVPVALKSGLDMVQATPAQRMRTGRRYARTGEVEDYLTVAVRASRAIADAGRRQDVACSQVLPKDLGDWQPTVEFALGPLPCGQDLADLSTNDLFRAAEHETGMFCRQGLGALIGKLAEGLPVQLATPVLRIDWSERNRIEIRTARGYVYARTAIVTASTAVLRSGKPVFDPPLPRSYIDALDKLPLGSRERIALELPGNPLALEASELVLEKAPSGRTAALIANVNGTALCTVEVGGRFGAGLAAAGEEAMTAFAREWLADLYGPEIGRAVRRTSATRWSHDPWTRGASSAAVPGGQWARAALAEPVRDRIFLAGEATHQTLWGTVGGAWGSGERAADAVLAKLGLTAEPAEPAKRAPARTSRRR